MNKNSAIIFVSGFNLQNKFINIEGTKTKAKIGRFSRRLRLGIFLRNTRLEYLSLNPNVITLIKIAVEKLNFLRKQNGIVNTLCQIFPYRVKLDLTDFDFQKRLTLRIIDDKRTCWVSRLAIIDGINPYSLNHSQEYDFARFPHKFSCFIWELKIPGVPKRKPINQQELVSKSCAIKIEVSDSIGQLTFKKVKNASVFHSRTTVCDDKVIPTDFHNFIDGSWPSDLVYTHLGEFFIFADRAKRKKFSGKYAFFGSSTSWFHFLIEVFPRFLRYDPDSLKQLTPLLERDTPKQILEVIDLVSDKKPLLLGTFEESVFEELTVCTEFRFPRGLDLVSRAQDINLVRNFFATQFDLGKVVKNQKIFVVRNRSLFRRSEIVTKLADYCSSLGFVVVDTGELSMKEQIELFASAKIVIGETGSSLTNLIFCHPKTSIIEINLHNFMANFFKDFCWALNLNHHEITEIHLDSGCITVKIDNMAVDLSYFLESI